MNIDLSNKNVLVTGASRGIGKAIAEQLLKSGAKVAAHYNATPVQLEGLTEDQLKNLSTFKADLSNADETAELFEQVINSLEHLDVIVNNAGLAIQSEVEGSLNDFVNKWQTTMAVNLQAVGILCKQAIMHFSERSSGIIINISSRAAFRGDSSDYRAYAA